MSRLTDRINSRTNIELPATQELRDRVLDFVEQVVDRTSGVIDDAPTPSEAARRVRRSRAIEVASGAIATAVPIGVEYLRDRREQVASMSTPAKTALVLRTAPKVLRFHPAVRTVALAGGVAGAALLVRRKIRSRRAERSLQAGSDRFASQASANRFELDEEVARMADEGGQPSSGRRQRSRIGR
ncbi:MAG: hypothetical protein JWM86_1845 [Thermoleophilia bacterium]|nr:hypothetical protein [Thermoleophilia bacterium]